MIRLAQEKPQDKTEGRETKQRKNRNGTNERQEPELKIGANKKEKTALRSRR